MKFKLLFSVLLIILPAFILAASAGTITGKVTDAKTNQTIPGATITIPQLRTSTIAEQKEDSPLITCLPKGGI
jgi:iron complex outermembrane receptor protein